MRKGFTRKIEPLKILSAPQIEQIHSMTLEILEKTGVKFENQRALVRSILMLSENEGADLGSSEVQAF